MKGISDSYIIECMRLCKDGGDTRRYRFFESILPNLREIYGIHIEGLPEGWEPVAYRKPKVGEFMLRDGGIRLIQEHHLGDDRLIVQKIQPRRIVLEETGEINKHDNYYQPCNQYFPNSGVTLSGMNKIWREVHIDK